MLNLSVDDLTCLIYNIEVNIIITPLVLLISKTKHNCELARLLLLCTRDHWCCITSTWHDAAVERNLQSYKCWHGKCLSFVSLLRPHSLPLFSFSYWSPLLSLQIPRGILTRIYDRRERQTCADTGTQQRRWVFLYSFITKIYITRNHMAGRRRRRPFADLHSRFLFVGYISRSIAGFEAHPQLCFPD